MKFFVFVFVVFVKTVWGSGVEVGATGMVPWLRIHTALAEDLSSIPSTHTRKSQLPVTLQISAHDKPAVSTKTCYLSSKRGQDRTVAREG